MGFLRKNVHTEKKIDVVGSSFEEFIKKVKDMGEDEVAELVETRKFFIESSERAYVQTFSYVCKRIDLEQRKTFVLCRPPFAESWTLTISDYNSNTTKVIC